MSRIMGKFDQRKSAAVVNLSGKHEGDLFFGCLRCQMDDTLNILYRIAVAVTISKTAVDQGCGSGPGESHKTVVSIPGIDHGIEGRAGGIDLQMAELGIPVVFQGSQFFCSGKCGILVFS